MKQYPIMKPQRVTSVIVSVLLVLVISGVQVNTQETTVDPAADRIDGNATTAKPQIKLGDEYKGPAGWLRICQPNGKYVGVVSTSNDECPAGYWFKEPLRVGCACGHGVWLFAKGWCDQQARIIIAKDGSCFNVNKDVKFVRQIGWAKDAFMPYSFVSTIGLEYIQPVPQVSTLSNRATHFHPEYAQHIGSIFRERAVESMSGRFCYSKAGNASRPLAMKYFVPKLPYFQKHHCFAYPNQDLTKFQYDVGYDINDGFSLQDEPNFVYSRKTWSLPADSAKCARECRSGRTLNMSGASINSFGSDYMDPLLDEYFVQDMNENGLKADLNATSPQVVNDDKCNKTYALSNKTMTEMKEQTKRMIILNIKTSIKSEPGPRVRYGDYKLVQKARKIMEKVCPSTELPPTVLIGMHRMFRVALNESFFHYPFRQLGGSNVTINILGILDKCLQDAKPMTFEYITETNITDGEKCTTRKFAGVKYTFQTNDSSVNRTIMAKLPCYLWSNITELDLPVETVWKTIMFTHYYCARHFKENSVGFSEFEQKMERFFNRWVQHRWFYPGLSLEGYKYVYNSYDLDKFAKSMDRCVAAARSFSVYRKWIKRPTYVQFDGKELFKEQYTIPDEVAGRTKLDAINPKLNQFDKKAYCLPYWHAPVSNPGLNYNPASDYKPGCVQYVKDDWKTPFAPLIGRPEGWRDSLDIL